MNSLSIQSLDSLSAVVEEVALSANRACGLSYENYTANFSAQIDALCRSLAPAEAELVLRIAKQTYDYHTPAELARQAEELRASGGCVHGFDEATCPCGCSEYFIPA